MLIWFTAAFATWSIVAVDPDTQEVGIAGATCSPMVWFIGGLAPGKGVVAAQYATSLPRKAQVVDALHAGDSPADALDPVVADDDKRALRQWAVVGLGGPPATFQGDDVELPADIVSGDTWSVQGNTLASDAVVGDAAQAWTHGDGLPLSERLLGALEAGAAAGGDARCDPSVAAKSAFLSVAAPDADPRAPSVELRTSGSGAVGALRPLLRAGAMSCSQSGGAGAAMPALIGAWLVRRRARQGREAVERATATATA
jgi:uncharacterized Ntn-hydrolase superfamily protein